MSPFGIGATLQEAEEFCRREGLGLKVETTRAPQPFAGSELRVVRVRWAAQEMEVLVASFLTVQEALP